MKIAEVEIAVPWGHIAGKTWGDNDNPHVLVFHGILDNAGSFDGLIPLLPPAFFYIAVDLPGHGRSSHFPPFLPIHSVDYVIAYKLLTVHFKQSQYTLMGHSYGGQIATVFAQLYPELVAKLVLIDSLVFFPLSTRNMTNVLRSRFEANTDLLEKLATGTPPTYTRQQALDKIRSVRSSDLTEEAAERLIQRSLNGPDGTGKYRFSFDQRLKFYLNPLYDMRVIVQTFEQNPIQCPILAVLAKGNVIQRTVFKPLLTYLRSLPNFQLVEIEGGHDVHNNSPEIVARSVSTFLLKKPHKL